MSLTCIICDKSLSTKSSLNRHMRTVEELPKKTTIFI